MLDDAPRIQRRDWTRPDAARVDALRGTPTGFVVDALHELYPPEGSATHDWYDIVTAEWAQHWPAEELWVAHLPA